MKPDAGRPGQVVRFPRPKSPPTEAAIREARAADARRLCAAVLSMADELRGWNADIARTQHWHCLFTAASRMAAEVLHPRNMNEAEARVFFEALTELTQALGYFANELGILAARGRQ